MQSVRHAKSVSSPRVRKFPENTPRLPRYEIRIKVKSSADWSIELFQLPSPSTQRITEPTYLAGLHGTPLRALEHRILKRLAREKIVFGSLRPGKYQAYPLGEDEAMILTILFRTLAPMRNIDRIREVADGIELMSNEELSWWLGMMLRRHKPQRVLAALRMLLTSK